MFIHNDACSVLNYKVAPQGSSRQMGTEVPARCLHVIHCDSASSVIENMKQRVKSTTAGLNSVLQMRPALQAARTATCVKTTVRGDLHEAGQTPVYDEPEACRSSDCFQNSCNKTVH